MTRFPLTRLDRRSSVAVTLAVFGLSVGFLWKQRRDVIGAPPRASGSRLF